MLKNRRGGMGRFWTGEPNRFEGYYWHTVDFTKIYPFVRLSQGKIPGSKKIKIHIRLQQNFNACMTFHSKIPGVECLTSCSSFFYLLGYSTRVTSPTVEYRNFFPNTGVD